MKDNKPKEDNKPNYEFVFNKIFTGSFLAHNLGHEIINFIKTDEGRRYVYLNAWGDRSEKAAKKTKYVLHIMKTVYAEKCYELVAVSEIDTNAKTAYNKDLEKESKEGLTFKKHSVYDIFHSAQCDNNAHLYSYITSNFYKPKAGYHIFIKVNSNEKPDINLNDNNIVMVNVKCNPQRSKGYSRDEDIEVLRELIHNYIEVNDDNINIEELDDELCFAVISDRTKLEDSTSNQIAYFLNRDKAIMNKFIKDFLKIDFDEKNEIFEVIREEHNIDLLIKSGKRIIVIENKINSKINGVDGEYSQLEKYYKYIIKDEKYKTISKHFFILEPEYGSITKKELQKYKYGNKFDIRYYHNLFEVLKKIEYKPYGDKKKISKLSKKADDEKLSEFLYKQFLKGIEYISWSKAKQNEVTAYIRLKQRIKELDRKSS